MSLAPGCRVGQYEVLAQIGEGGMGEVYRARDTKLDRDVALKILPEAFTSDPERLARFQREAKVLASLNHANIAHVYGLEESTEVRAIVMEFVDGPTLADLIARQSALGSRLSALGTSSDSGSRQEPRANTPRPRANTPQPASNREGLPLDEALPIARQIAEALEAAHERGIIHRDLKPANIKVTPAGVVKVLDFGLAKALDAGASGAREARGPRGEDLAESPTMTRLRDGYGGQAMSAAATRAGFILGTAAYMSPEQAKGRDVDKRADIWAFGVVLFEMLAGGPLFEGDSVADVLGAVLRQEIDLVSLPASIPAGVHRLLRHCLARDPKERLHDIADARIALRDVDERQDDGEVSLVTPPEAPVRSAWRRPLVWIAIAAAAGAGGLLVRTPGSSLERSQPPMHLSIQLGPDQSLFGVEASGLAFDPTGNALVLAAMSDGRQMLYRRDLDASDVRPIEGTVGGSNPFFSPDGSWLGFTARDRLWKVDAAGGRPLGLADQLGAGGAVWLPDDTIVFAPVYSDGLFRMSAEGGAPERITTPDRAQGVLGHWWPSALPGGKQILFTAFRTPVDRSWIGVVSLETGEVRRVVEGAFFGRYLPTGHIVYTRDRRVFAARFDSASATVSGPEVPVVDEVASSPTNASSLIDVSTRGTLAYVTTSVVDPGRELVWVDRDGRAEPALPDTYRLRNVRLSPDGRRAAASIMGDSLDLWMIDLSRRTVSRITSDAGTESNPIWSPDGRELFFTFDRPPYEPHRMAVDSSEAGRTVWAGTQLEVDDLAEAVSPDGRWLLFTRSNPETGDDLWVRAVDGSAPGRAFRAERGMELHPSFSPDGRWLAYEADETGRSEIYVEAFPGPGQRFQVSADGGSEPVWARESGEIFYRHADEIFVIGTRLADGFEFDAPRRLFALASYSSAGDSTTAYDVTPDGQRLLMIRTPEASRPRRIEIVTDWLDEVRRRVP